MLSRVLMLLGAKYGCSLSFCAEVCILVDSDWFASGKKLLLTVIPSMDIDQ